MKSYLSLIWISFKNKKVYKLNVLFRVISSVVLIVVVLQIIKLPSIPYFIG
ncbi:MULTISPECIES: hypothetical protein [unclassified Paenibacillus]|uniref:hypothetical protein n=1 Tax=unclassified Paenibacillus TaxID=185978 RepID=UPI00278B0C54|nr:MULTISPECIES: hypothetical protein [unclassified Paenibacillus]MDQ0901174.1 hypothetical protein [Paenibacillus sp. V4I7]MDQ0920348.1 hypothetical protein [Paenibacillus sp. V4I5]